jgi:glycosyltransferase involved in cell wall biosynthesis
MVRDVGEAVAVVENAVAECRKELGELRAELARQDDVARDRQERTLLAIRMVRDHDVAARRALWKLRAKPEYEMAFDEDEPLVSVIIPTYLEWPLLRDRSIPSVLAQTYERWEAIVVGDAAPDETRQVVESFGDARIRFVNLPYRGPYPNDPRSAWLVSGTVPWNTGLALAKGRWIGATGDDDALRPTYLESLLTCARQERAEVPYGLLHSCAPDSDGMILGTFPPEHGQWGMQAALFHGALRFLPLEPSDWVFGIPNDWALAERMLRIGVRFAMIDQPVADLYPHHLWTERDSRRTPRAVVGEAEGSPP